MDESNQTMSAGSERMLVINTMHSSEADRSSLLQRFTLIWLAGMLVLLPLDLIKLPLNMQLVDVWILMGLPIFWVSFLRGSHIVGLSYAIPMWLIFVGSFISIFVAPAPKNSLIVLLKEGYAFVWFITLATVLAKLNTRDLRRILVVWTGVVLLHGGVIVAQLVSPSFWQLIVNFAGKSSDFDIYRSPGLFMNPNSAAFFQVLGFVPLVLAGFPKRVAMLLGVLLLLTMLPPASLGAIAAFIAGLTVAVIVLSVSGHFILTIKTLAQVAIAISLLSGLLYFGISHNERYQDHFQHILLGRAERSSEERFDLWQRGFNAYLDHEVLLLGVGPENFREVDAKMSDNQLHNDFLAFSVERGLFGTLGLGLFAVLAMTRAAYMALISRWHPHQTPLIGIVFMAAIVAAIIESLSHQVFHFRDLWLVLALQEAMLYRMTMSEPGLEPTVRTLDGTPRYGRGLVVRPDVRGG